MEESILMWNRLESSLRNESQIENALRFEIRDALWMLTRQWQFGELEGEDAGTAAFVQIDAEQSAITALGSQKKPPQSFDVKKMPFEIPLEREKFNPGIADRLEMGRQWERILTKRLPAVAKTIIKQFKNIALFHFSPGLNKTADEELKFQHAQLYSDDDHILLAESLAHGRAIDGYAFLMELKSGRPASIFLPQPDEAVNAAGKEFIEWFNRVYQQSSIANSWHENHFEYQPQLCFPDATGKSTVLRKEEYYGEGLAWYGFEPTKFWDGQSQQVEVSEQRKIIKETLIPGGVRFRGMPSKRLWQMEDAQVDFGSIRASSTELNKMLFAEFGLVYGNDWMVAPLHFSYGTMCRVTGMVITDTFGNETKLTEKIPDRNWAFFQNEISQSNSRWLFLANASDIVQESSPVEKVSFLRDEMANMVWGVEEIISSPFGGGRDGEQQAKKTVRLVESFNSQHMASEKGKVSGEGWRYKAGTLMAENRIPFIPLVPDAAQAAAFKKRKVILQRAATARVADQFVPVRIRPRTSLLGHTGAPENQRPAPIFIFEEEVPKTGMKLSLVWKRTRWFNGQTLQWLARKKTVGSGEINANFVFDTLKKNNS
jgi:hypothetical protein